MTKITKLDKTALKNLREPIEAELKALGERLGLNFALGNGTFGDGAEASFKLIIKVDDPATMEAAARAEWNRNCRYIGIDFDTPDDTGLRPEDFGTEFKYGRSIYRTSGIATKGRNSQKYPILVTVVSDADGKRAPGATVMLPEIAVPMIRAATDAKTSA